jgi:hypothetical protein
MRNLSITSSDAERGVNHQRSGRVTMMIRQSTQEVEDNGAESSCRGIVNIACTRCAEDINTRYREEIGLLLL